MSNLSEKQTESMNAFRSFVGSDSFTRADYSDFKSRAKELDVILPRFLIRNNVCEKINRGEYRFPTVNGTSTETVDTSNMVSPEKTEEVSLATNVIEFPKNVTESYVPAKVSNYVKFGHYNDVKTIKKSGQFYPVFITGLSGNGKTMMIEQVHADLKKELFRVNITIETDEDDLLGHYALIDGNTVWQDGPVIIAMERGAVLLLDEIDLASNKVMCLQPILEGKGVYLKKINRMVTPAAGFTVVATANTKGKGSEDGRFVFTNILNEAFLERFPITMEVNYPSAVTEKKIVNKVLDSLGVSDSDFAEKLVNWANTIRKTFFDGGIDEVIATRRLVHISNAFAIFGDRMKSIEMCVNRFDEDTKTSFLDLYSKIDAEAVIPSDENESEETVSEDSGYASEKDENNPF